MTKQGSGDLDETTAVQALAPLSRDPELCVPTSSHKTEAELDSTCSRPAVTSAILAYAFSEARDAGPPRPAGAEGPTLWVQYEELSSEELQSIDDLEAAEVAPTTEDAFLVDPDLDRTSEVRVADDLEKTNELKAAADTDRTDEVVALDDLEATDEIFALDVEDLDDFEDADPPCGSEVVDEPMPCEPKRQGGSKPPCTDVIEDAPSDSITIAPTVVPFAHAETAVPGPRDLRRAMVPTAMLGALVGTIAVGTLFLAAPPGIATSTLGDIPSIALPASASPEPSQPLELDPEPLCSKPSGATLAVCEWVSGAAAGEFGRKATPSEIQQFFVEQDIRAMKAYIRDNDSLIEPKGAIRALADDDREVCLVSSRALPPGNVSLWAEGAGRTSAVAADGDRFDCTEVVESRLPNHLAMLSAASHPARQQQLAQLVLKDLESMTSSAR